MINTVAQVVLVSNRSLSVDSGFYTFIFRRGRESLNPGKMKLPGLS